MLSSFMRFLMDVSLLSRSSSLLMNIKTAAIMPSLKVASSSQMVRRWCPKTKTTRR